MTTDDGEQQGATVGSHKVVLHDLGMFPDKIAGGLRVQEDVDLSEGKKPRIASEYTDPQKSSLKADVVAGQKNEVSLDVKPFSASGGCSITGPVTAGSASPEFSMESCNAQAGGKDACLALQADRQPCGCLSVKDRHRNKCRLSRGEGR